MPSIARRVAWSVLLVPALLSPCRAGEQASKPPKKNADNSTSQKHFLWQVQSKSTTVYLLGSVHAAKKDLYPLADVIEKAFEKSQKLALEIHMDKRTEMQAAVKLIAVGRYKGADTIDKHISKEVKEKLDTRLKKAGIPAGAFAKFKPWLVSIMLSVQELERLGYKAEFGIDKHFQARAAKAGKPIVSLESVDLQVKMFAGLSEKLQESLLKQSLDDIGKVGETMEKTFAAWKRGDAEAIDKLLLTDMRKKEYRGLFKTIFTDRNIGMARKIEEFLKGDSTVFVVVGGGHMIGKEGIVELLKAKKKYQIKQL